MKNNMKKISVLIMACSMGVAAQAQLIDDFSGTLSPYTLSPMLVQGNASTVSFTDPSGALQATLGSYNGLVQALFLRSDYSLGVGQTLSADVNFTLTGSQDFGLCVASTATPTAVATGATGDTRNNASLAYAFIGVRSLAWHVVASGWNDGTALSTLQYQVLQGTNQVTGVFITRTSATTFNMGYDMNNTGNVVLGTYTTDPNVGTAIGFYVDMRANGTIGTMDNLTISVPEPTTMTLCGLGGFLGLVGWMRRKK